jgi:hypothetical protein
MIILDEYLIKTSNKEVEIEVLIITAKHQTNLLTL